MQPSFPAVIRIVPVVAAEIRVSLDRERKDENILRRVFPPG
jgi:hypothetical protein